MTRYFVVEDIDDHEKAFKRSQGQTIPKLPSLYSDRPTLRWADTLPKARLKAVAYLKTQKNRTWSVAVVKEGERIYREGMVYLNSYGTGVWRVGRYTWMINSKDGSIYDKSYSW